MITRLQQRYIEKNHRDLSAEDIASDLGVSVEFVRGYLGKLSSIDSLLVKKSRACCMTPEASQMIDEKG